MPKIYTVIIDVHPCTMTNNSGMTRDDAAEYKHANDKAFRMLGGVK